MIIFEHPSISSEKPASEQLRQMRSYIDDLVDSLNMLAQEIEQLKKGEK